MRAKATPPAATHLAASIRVVASHPGRRSMPEDIRSMGGLNYLDGVT
jgi:hypothetical protein